MIGGTGKRTDDETMRRMAAMATMEAMRTARCKRQKRTDECFIGTLDG